MNHKRTSTKLFHRAQQLRHEMTPAEIKLWSYLRANRMEGVHFRNQHAIGDYILDFCAPRRKLVIELDGGHHLEEGQSEHDAERTAFLQSRGYKVLRFWNDTVLNDIDSVLKIIRASLND